MSPGGARQIEPHVDLRLDLRSEWNHDGTAVVVDAELGRCEARPLVLGDQPLDCKVDRVPVEVGADVGNRLVVVEAERIRADACTGGSRRGRDVSVEMEVADAPPRTHGRNGAGRSK